jgi:hypothetical protein
MIMKKYLIIIFVLLHGILFAEELQFKVLERAKYVPLLGRDQINYLEKDSIVTCRNTINYSQNLTDDFSFSISILLLKDDGVYWTEAEKLIPMYTHDVFSPDIAINHSRENKELWVPYYYAEVLHSRERDTLIDFESSWLPWEAIDDRTGEILDNWHMSYSINYNGEVMFYNAAIRLTMSNRCLMVKDIQKIEHGYRVVCFTTDYLDFGQDAGSYFDYWFFVKHLKYFTLFILEDGDYLDLFVNNRSQQFGALIKIRQEFAEQFESLIKTNTCDLTNVQWPRRADVYSDLNFNSFFNAKKEDKQPEPIELSVDTEDPLAIQNGAKTSAMPLWARLAIIGGAVVIAGSVVVFAVRRKK